MGNVVPEKQGEGQNAENRTTIIPRGPLSGSLGVTYSPRTMR
jgi:hypothetical protein